MVFIISFHFLLSLVRFSHYFTLGDFISSFVFPIISSLVLFFVWHPLPYQYLSDCIGWLHLYLFFFYTHYHVLFVYISFAISFVIYLSAFSSGPISRSRWGTQLKVELSFEYPYLSFSSDYHFVQYYYGCLKYIIVKSLLVTLC